MLLNRICTKLSTFSVRHLKVSSAATVMNSLKDEKSPYLLQHKGNPIEWYPWGQQAFEKSKSLDKPIFLSIGYSTCHWCHVMERESFVDEDVAKFLNENFVSIKVDREERPDVDSLYMSFIQAMNDGSGGWPMSVFLTPTLQPFFGGTYFPRNNFIKLLKAVSENWKTNKEVFLHQGKAFIKALNKEYTRADVPPVDNVLQMMLQYKIRTFDKRDGGFGDQPKFPKPVDLDFLLKFSNTFANEQEKSLCLEMLRTTLKAMARGGIHDHIGKGFHRYSVDGEWHVPHFEKMLYDQTQLLSLYSDYCRAVTPDFVDVVRDIADYMLDNLRHSEGGFFSAEDADSYPFEGSPEKKEGAFCVWKKSEIIDGINDTKLSDVFCSVFDVHDEGNVLRVLDPHGELDGQNVLRMKQPLDMTAIELGLELVDLKRMLDDSKEKLRVIRKSRPPPHLDSKMVTSWQGLAISALAKASVALSDATFVDFAEKCVEFVRKHNTDEHGELLRASYTSPDGCVENTAEPIRAFSDDYSFLIEGLLDLYSVNADETLLKWAIELQDSMDEMFWDTANNSGYFISEKDGNSLEVRQKEVYDNVEPCANSVAVGNLLRLSVMMDSQQYKTRAQNIVEGSSQQLGKYPFTLPKMLYPFKLLDGNVMKIVVVGTHKDTQELRSIISSTYLPQAVIVHLVVDRDHAFLSATNPVYLEMTQQSRPAVFICEGETCGLPIYSVDELRNRLTRPME